MKTILMKLAGPLQSWGTRSHFETRHTDFYPSKSAVIGMIAASLGLRRDEDEGIQKLNDLDFAVRIDRQGLLLRDYHTARKYKPNGDFDRTYVTNRYYLEDAVFVVAVGHQDEAWIDSIVRGLEAPYFQPFMGRRSLPVPADFLLEVTKTDVIEALRNLPRQAGRRFADDTPRKLTVYADADLLTDKPSTLRKDRVLSFSQKDRQFGYRAEAKMEIAVRDEQAAQEHDAFGAIGG